MATADPVSAVITSGTSGKCTHQTTVALSWSIWIIWVHWAHRTGRSIVISWIWGLVVGTLLWELTRWCWARILLRTRLAYLLLVAAVTDVSNHIYGYLIVAKLTMVGWFLLQVERFDRVGSHRWPAGHKSHIEGPVEVGHKGSLARTAKQ